MAETPNHYAVLGLTRAFDEQQLKRQYRLLALKHHPDRNRGNEDAASRQFKLIAEAHAVLGDPKARRAYDLELIKQMALSRRRGARSHQQPPRRHAEPPPVPPPEAAAAAAAAAKARAAHRQASARQAARATPAAAQPPPHPQRPVQPPPLPPRPDGGAASGDPRGGGGGSGGGGGGGGVGSGPELSEEWDGMDAALEASEAEAHAAQMAAIANEEAEIAAAVREVEQRGQSHAVRRAPARTLCLLRARLAPLGGGCLVPSSATLAVTHPHPHPYPHPHLHPALSLNLTLQPQPQPHQVEAAIWREAVERQRQEEARALCVPIPLSLRCVPMTLPLRRRTASIHPSSIHLSSPIYHPSRLSIRRWRRPCRWASTRTERRRRA